MPETFNTSYGLKIEIPEIVKEIVSFMRAKPVAEYKIIIGSDSELLEDKSADFVTAIVVHRVGNGGRYFWRRGKLGKFYNLHDRIVQEVMLSLDTAKVFFATLKTETARQDPESALKWSFEIHIDAGENGPTKTLIQEVVGMVRASNFEPKTKPESYAASNVADRYV
ncbi:ribonuclease H-like YkuK family protein [Patescibacteria group bacterium]|nr:ribonuclease H-like YkuK family protein [Patescibacteria group bacterium]